MNMTVQLSVMQNRITVLESRITALEAAIRELIEQLQKKGARRAN